MFAFQKLEIYQLSKELVKETYGFTRTFPQNEQYGLTSQMNRSVISISSNIAESTGRPSFKDKVHFISIAIASLMELTCQYDIALDIGYIDDIHFENMMTKITSLSVKINNYKLYLADKDKAAKKRF